MGSNIQKSGEAVKRLDRLAPNLVHVGDSSGNGHINEQFSKGRSKNVTEGVNFKL